MKRYAVITSVEVWAGEERIGSVEMEEGIGYKAKLDDSFMSKDDICFLGKVLEHMDEDGDLTIEEEI